MALSPVRAQGVSALELAKAQREVFAQQQSLAAKQVDFTQNVLQERLQKELAIRNQEMRYTDAMINSATAKNLQTLTELEKADNDPFRGVKAFFSDDVKSVEELEAQRTYERENIRTLSNIKRTLSSNYASKYEEAAFTAAGLDAEALLYDQQVQDIQKALTAQSAALRLEAEEQVADISQYSLESLKKLRENPDSTLLPQGKIEETIIGREKLLLANQAALGVARGGQPTVAQLFNIRKEQLEYGAKYEPLSKLQQGLKAAKESNTGMASLNVAGLAPLDFSVREWESMIETNKAATQKRDTEALDSALAAQTLSYSTQAATDVAARLGLSPETPFGSHVRKLQIYNTASIEEAKKTGALSSTTATAINELTRQTSSIMDEAIAEQVKRFPKQEREIRSSYLKTGVVSQPIAFSNLNQIPVLLSDNLLRMSHGKQFQALAQLNSNIQKAFGNKYLRKDGSTDYNLMAADQGRKSKNKEQLEFSETIRAALTKKPDGDDVENSKNKSPVDWLQEDLLSEYVDFMADKHNIKDLYPTLWGADRKGKFANGKEFINKMFMQDLKNREETSMIGAFLVSMFAPENINEFNQVYGKTAGNQFATAFISGLISGNNTAGYLQAVLSEQFGQEVIASELNEIQEDFAKATGDKTSSRFTMPGTALMNMFPATFRVENEDTFKSQKDVFEPTMKSAAKQLYDMFGIELEEK